MQFYNFFQIQEVYIAMFFFFCMVSWPLSNENKQTNESKAEQYLFSRGADCYTA